MSGWIPRLGIWMPDIQEGVRYPWLKWCDFQAWKGNLETAVLNTSGRQQLLGGSCVTLGKIYLKMIVFIG